MDTTVLNLKIPSDAHKKIKSFAVMNGEKLIPLANQIIIDASEKKEVLEEALKNLNNEKK